MVPGLRKSTQLYIVVVGTLGLALLGLSWLWSPQAYSQSQLQTAVLFLLLNVVSEHYVIHLPRGGLLAASTVTQIAGLLILPPPLVLLITAVSCLADDVLTRRQWYKTLFNVGQILLAVGLPAVLINAFGQTQNVLVPGNAAQGGILALTVVLMYYAINTILTNIIVAIEQRMPLKEVFLDNNSTGVLLDIGMGVIGVLWAYIWLIDPFWSALAVIPAIMICRAFSYIRQLEDENKLGILKIAETIDERDAYTYQHSTRVAEYTEKIAKKLQLNPVQVDQLVTAARLHDLGKLGVRDDVLHKPGALDQPEWEIMRRHPEIGAKIVGHYQLHKESVDCVLYHHERYDGKGYPHRLKGEAIPLGARIMAVADSFEAMTSDRPYRKALSQEVAIERLKEGMGTQFDPMMVAAFLTVLEQATMTEASVPQEALCVEKSAPAPQPSATIRNVQEVNA